MKHGLGARGWSIPFVSRMGETLDIHQDYDVIIIGSGMSGLTTAGCLARAGLKVLVLERHHTAGGMTHTFQRQGYEWAVGVHYVGEVHRPHSMLRSLFDHISDKQLQWQKLRDPYDRIILSEGSYDFPAGKDAFRNQLNGYFPAETTAIDRYLWLLEDVQKSVRWFVVQKILPRFWGSPLRQLNLTGRFYQYARTTTAEMLRELSLSPLLHKVLTAQWLDYGLPPEKSSFAMHALVARHYLDGASYPVGGPKAIASSIKAVIERHGGRVETNTPAASIVVDKDRAIGVTLARGERLHAETIVSAAGYHTTYESLIPRQISIRPDFISRLATVMPSTGHIGLYLGLKTTAEKLGLRQGNLWILRDDSAPPEAWRGLEHILEGRIPVMFVSFPSTRDPLWSEHHPGTSTIEMVVPAPWSVFQPWQNTRWQRRGETYNTLKQNLIEHLLLILSSYIPGLKDHLDHVELSTPLTTAHFCNAYHGAMYGLSHDPERFLMPTLHPDSGIDRLFLTGQDIVTCGLGGAALSGALTALRILGPWRGRHLIKLLLEFA